MEQINLQIHDLLQRQCKFHKNHKISMLQFSSKYQFHEICILCLQKFQILPSEFISIESILSANDETIFSSFPPLEDDAQQSLNNMSEDQSKIDDVIEKIRQYIGELKTHVQQLIQQVENNMKQKIISLQNLQSDLMKQYNSISSKNELKQLIINDNEHYETKFKQLVNNKFENKKDNTEKIKSISSQYFSILNNFDFQLPNQIKDILTQLIPKIDFFLKNDSTSSDKKQNIEIKYVDIIQNLVSSKTNYCTDQFLDTTQQILKKYSILLNDNQINGQPFDQNKRNSFNLLNKEQLEQIRGLSQKQQEISMQYMKKYSGNIQEFEITNEIQHISFNIIQHLKGILPPGQIQNISRLFKQYPIFETKMYQEQNSLLESTYFIKQNCFCPNTQLIQRNQLNQIYIAAQQNICSIAYTNFIINPYKKYIFRVYIQSNPYINQSDISFGLINDQSKGIISVSEQKMCFRTSYNYCGINKIVKGSGLNSGIQQQCRRQFEVRIFQEGQILRIADYPNYYNVCEIDDRKRLSIQESYRFATQVFFRDELIVIKNILEVKEFDNKM